MLRWIYFFVILVQTLSHNGVVLVIIDGFGESSDTEIDGIFVANAVVSAKTPTLDKFKRVYPYTTLEAAGMTVGMRPNDPGNSIVGHQTIGLGRTLPWYPLRIDVDIAIDQFSNNPVFQELFDVAQKGSKRLHIAGVLEEKGINSEYSFFLAAMKMATEYDFEHVFLHCWLSNDNKEPNEIYIQMVLDLAEELGVGTLATVMGAAWPQDRDLRWDRTQAAYEAMHAGVGQLVALEHVMLNIQHNAQAEKGDFYMDPIIVASGPNAPVGEFEEGDVLFFVNHREDSMIQLTSALHYGPGNGPQHSQIFVDFESKIKHQKLAQILTMVEYADYFEFPVVYEPLYPDKTLGQVISDAGLTQLRIAESHKEKHIGMYLNGGIKNAAAFKNEERVVVDSPEKMQPEMNVTGVTTEVINAISSNRKYQFIAANLASPDAMGHNGIFEDAVVACEIVDEALSRLYEATEAHGYILVVTSDHGNAEEMLYYDGVPHKSHTDNTVPFLVLDDRYKIVSHTIGMAQSLANIAPSVLKILGLKVPPEMIQPIVSAMDQDNEAFILNESSALLHVSSLSEVQTFGLIFGACLGVTGITCVIVFVRKKRCKLRKSQLKEAAPLLMGVHTKKSNHSSLLYS